MNLKGQWNKLKYWEQNYLKHFAIIKNWRSYWYYKQRYLIQYEEKHKYILNGEIQSECN